MLDTILAYYSHKVLALELFNSLRTHTIKDITRYKIFTESRKNKILLIFYKSYIFFPFKTNKTKLMDEAVII